MKSKLAQLEERRLRLIARSDMQCDRLSAYYRQFDAPLRVAGLLAGLFGALRRSPLAVTGAAAVLVRTPWRRLARWPKRLWRAWRVLRYARDFTRRL